jgi:hypothetical protein
VSLVIQVSDLPTFSAAGLFASCSFSHASKLSPGVFEGMKQEHFASDLLGLATS